MGVRPNILIYQDKKMLTIRWIPRNQFVFGIHSSCIFGTICIYYIYLYKLQTTIEVFSNIQQKYFKKREMWLCQKHFVMNLNRHYRFSFSKTYVLRFFFVLYLEMIFKHYTFFITTALNVHLKFDFFLFYLRLCSILNIYIY